MRSTSDQLYYGISGRRGYEQRCIPMEAAIREGLNMITLSEQIGVYEAMRDTLEADNVGGWVIIYGGEFIGAYDSFEEAADWAVRRYGRGPSLIRQAGVPPMPLPTSVVYRPLDADG